MTTEDEESYTSHYPPLHKFLTENKSQCDWQMPLGDPDQPLAYLESHQFSSGRSAIVLVWGNRGGWEIYTAGARASDAALLDAADRLGLK